MDFTSNATRWTSNQLRMAGRAVKVDIVARANKLPLEDGSQQFVLNSHVIEHLEDPIGAVEEWLRVLKPPSAKGGGGYVYMIVPDMRRTPDKEEKETDLAEIARRHEGKQKAPAPNSIGHVSFWTSRAFLRLCLRQNWRVVAIQERDDKVGNGFTVVLRKGY